MERFTGTVYSNEQAVTTHNGSNINELTASLLVHLECSSSGSHATIVDNTLGGTVIERFRKSPVGD